MADLSQELKNYIFAQSEKVAEIQEALVKNQAIAPENGGDGESCKAAVIAAYLEELGITAVEHVDSPDTRVSSGVRPNIIARIAGKSDKTLWLYGHMDVVPPGDRDLWNTDPFRLHRDGDYLYGRGVEDNQQALASMLVLAEALQKLKITPELGLALVFMSDEECGSRHGLQWILQQRPELFRADDYHIVPDGGSADGLEIEIAEKAQLWVKFIVEGRQCHASAPQNGLNAFSAASQLVCALEQGLYAAFPEQDELFSPSFSTFVPTRHDGNNVGINILPGKDIFYLDCRFLPQIPFAAVKKEIEAICARIAEKCALKISAEYVQFQNASATDARAPVLKALRAAIKAVYAGEARNIGIGGASVAAMLRQRNIPTAVWARVLNTCHQPNEKSQISSTLGDAAVFAHIIMNRDTDA